MPDYLQNDISEDCSSDVVEHDAPAGRELLEFLNGRDLEYIEYAEKDKARYQ